MSPEHIFFSPSARIFRVTIFCSLLLEKYFFIHFLISTLKNVLNFVRQFLFIFSFLMLPFQLKRKTKDGRNIFSSFFKANFGFNSLTSHYIKNLKWTQKKNFSSHLNKCKYFAARVRVVRLLLVIYAAEIITEKT